jgi:uncharacterized protein (TIGR03083 family)
MSDAPRRRIFDELGVALAEADAHPVGDELRWRVLDRALTQRAAGPQATPPPHLDGASVFTEVVAQMDALLAGLDDADWLAPSIRGLDVQGLIGHLVGVELAFFHALTGASDGSSFDHVESTQPVADAQRGRPATETFADWRRATARSRTAVEAAPADAAPSFYGIALPMDELLVVRAFELWVHHEDVRRATSRPPAAPEPAVLARMTELAAALLPAGLARAGTQRRRSDPAVVRLVLTGPGGGTWHVPLDGSPAGHPKPRALATARVVLDAVDFCRVVGNRAGLDTVDALVSGDHDQVRDLFVGAAALALD